MAIASAEPALSHGYSASYDCGGESALIEQYLPLVKKVVSSVARNLPSQVEVDDLHSVGTMGLIAAVRRYDVTQEKTFEAYAMLRIRGAVLDELRRLDYLPRTARATARQLQGAVHELEQRFGREPTEEEVCDELGVKMSDLKRMRRQSRPVSFMSLDCTRQSEESDVDLHDAIPDESQALGSEEAQQNELIEMLKTKLMMLQDRQRRVLAMIYKEEMRLSEIAEVFGVTEARICQIRNQAIANLRRHMQTVIQE